jgi:hypothetical protein
MIRNDRHAHYVGWVWGIALNNGLDVKPMVNIDGDYTDRLVMTFPSGEIVVLIVPPPPPEWDPFQPTGESNERQAEPGQ